MNKRFRTAALATAMASLAITTASNADELRGPMMWFPNAAGMSATYVASGRLDTSNPFFQKLGTNGRSCDTCHQPSDGWSVTPQSVQRRFDATGGADPIFRTNDASVSPDADVSTLEARRAAYAMLLSKGLICVGIGIPDDAEFELADADDPYGYASARELSLFRRPLPSANLKFLSAVMWDGRETFADATSTDCIRGTTRCFAPLHFDLADQANGATTRHAQAARPLSSAQREAIVGFEMGLFTAQAYDRDAKILFAAGTHGGPLALARMPAYFGINDAVHGDYQTGAPFDPNVFHLYDAWDGATGDRGSNPSTADARRAVARGQALFNAKPIRIQGVGGLNDEVGVDTIDGTCTTCHDTPGAGNHSIPAPLDLGLADAKRATPDLPIYVLRNKTTGALVETTDPGRALITGNWKDIGRFKGPVLRGLAARPPYFHNGSAADLAAVVDFYDQRFGIGLTAQEKSDLVAFLRTL